MLLPVATAAAFIVAGCSSTNKTTPTVTPTAPHAVAAISSKSAVSKQGKMRHHKHVFRYSK